MEDMDMDMMGGFGCNEGFVLLGLDLGLGR